MLQLCKVLFLIVIIFGGFDMYGYQQQGGYDPLAMAAMMNMMQGNHVQGEYIEGQSTSSRFLLLLRLSVEQGFFGGIQWGIANCISPMIKGCFSGIPTIFSAFERFLSKKFNALCRRPDPLHADEIGMWQEMVEQIVNSISDHVETGTIMLRNMRVNDNEPHAVEDTNWLFFVSYIEETFLYISDCLRDHLPHYQENKEQCRWLVRVANSCRECNSRAITFVITMIVTNLHHLIDVCKNAEAVDDIDISHIRRVSRNLLLLFKKLRILVGDEKKRESCDTLSGIDSSSMAHGIIDY